MKYFLIAGEPSGDQHGSMLMESILSTDPKAEFRFLGGDHMARIGGEPVVHIRDLAFMGFTQLIIKVFKIKKTFRSCKKELVEFQPDIVVPIDYGGFNLRLIPWLKKRNFRVVYYITPKVWAWMPSRAKKLARYTDMALCILPFEKDFLQRFGVRSEYVGNPVRDYIGHALLADPAVIRTELKLDDQPVIALLPGSRTQEIARILPVMKQMVSEFTDYQFVIAGHVNFPKTFYHQTGIPSDVPVFYGNTLELLRISSAALVTSGTATLEAALMGAPQVVCYKTASASYLIARLLIRIKYISLVNLILDRSCVQELIQDRLNASELRTGLNRVLNDREFRREQLRGYQELTGKLGDNEASATAAGIICRMARES